MLVASNGAVVVTWPMPLSYVCCEPKEVHVPIEILPSQVLIAVLDELHVVGVSRLCTEIFSNAGMNHRVSVSMPSKHILYHT